MGHAIRRCSNVLKLTALAVLIGWGPLAAAQPANDNFANRTAISGDSGTTNGNNAGATTQDNEPLPFFAHGATAWWSLTPDSDGRMEIDTFGSNFDTTLIAYSGDSLPSLQTLAINDDDGDGVQSRVSVAARAGVPIQISVGGFFGETGNITLNWRLSNTRTANDNLNAAVDIRASDGASPGGSFGFIFDQDNIIASSQTGEPDIGGESGANSVWFEYEADRSGETMFITATSFGQVLNNFVLDVFDGSVVNNLTRVANSSGAVSSVKFETTAGTTYRIAVAGMDGFAGSFDLQWSVGLPPVNDDLENAAVLSGGSGQVTSSNLLATSQTTESDSVQMANGHRSLWWRWTAGGNGQASFDLSDNRFPYYIAIYEGMPGDQIQILEQSQLDPIFEQQDHTVDVSAGQTYYVQVIGANNSDGDVILKWDATTDSIAQPKSGWYWNPDESGRGWNIEIRGGTLFMSGYMYDEDGTPVWYIAGGAITSTEFSGDLRRFSNGQTLTGPYTPNDGPESVMDFVLEFIADDQARIILEDNTVIELQRLVF